VALLLVLTRLARARSAAGDATAARALAEEARDVYAKQPAVPPQVAPEILFTLRELLADESYLEQAHRLVCERTTVLRNDAHREHFLTRTWPNAEILEEVKRIQGS
jgi:hypothetical protein